MNTADAQAAIDESSREVNGIRTGGHLVIPEGRHKISGLRIYPYTSIEAWPGSVIYNDGNQATIVADRTLWGVEITGGTWQGRTGVFNGKAMHSVSKSIFARMRVDAYFGFVGEGFVANSWQSCSFRCKSSAILMGPNRQSNHNRIRDCWFQSWEAAAPIEIQHGYKNVVVDCTIENGKNHAAVVLGNRAKYTTLRDNYLEAIDAPCAVGGSGIATLLSANYFARTAGTDACGLSEEWIDCHNNFEGRPSEN